MFPVELSVNCMFSGAIPLVVFAVKFAVKFAIGIGQLTVMRFVCVCVLFPPGPVTVSVTVYFPGMCMCK